MTHRRSLMIWAVAGIMAVSLIWATVGAITATAIAGMIGGAVIGSNLPEKYRRRLIVKLPLVG